MKSFVKTIQALAVAAALGTAGASAFAANVITFDPNGAAPGGAVQITNLDQAVGNALAVGASALSPVGTNFNLLYQANLANANNGNTAVFTNGDGGNFFTFVARFGETITDNNALANGGRSLGFGFDAAAPSFFNVFRTAAAGNDLTGLGFTAGTSILSGHIVGTGFVSGFNTGAPGAAVALDQSANGNNYPGITTLTGAGSTDLTVVIDSFDVNYFPDLVVGGSLAFVNTSQILPFRQTDPSACFSSTGTPASDCTQIGVPTVGAINGISGPNTIFQADANSSFETNAVPEPISLALVGLGLLGVGVSRRIKR